MQLDRRGADHLIPLAEVMTRTSLKKTSIWRLIREGAFPKAITISPGRVAWPSAQIDQWIQDKIEEANSGEAA